jgi:hypothetical protein
MATNPSPGYFPDQSANVGGKKTLCVKWVSGSSGAVATTYPFMEVTSVTLSSTSTYTIQFTQAWATNGSRGMIETITQASYSKTGACHLVKISDDSTAGTLVVMAVDAAGDATAPTTGDILELEFDVVTYAGPATVGP